MAKITRGVETWWDHVLGRRASFVKKGDLVMIGREEFTVRKVDDSTTLYLKDRFVPWWMGFKLYWQCWKEYSHFHWRRDRFDRRVRCHPIGGKHRAGMLYPYHSLTYPWAKRAFETEAIGWSVVIRTPLAMIHIAKCSRSYNRDGYQSGIAVSWLPKRWSLRLREAEAMYRHERSWMSFIPKMAIKGLR